MMFTSAEYQLLGKRAPEDLKGFFEALGIPATAVAWEDREKVRRLDAEAEKKVEGLLRSMSIIDGCYTLLERAKIPFQFSDTTGMLLTAIVKHQEDVRRVMTMKLPSQPQSIKKGEASSRQTTVKVSRKATEGGVVYWVLEIITTIGKIIFSLVRCIVPGVESKGMQRPPSPSPSVGRRQVHGKPSAEFQKQGVSPTAASTVPTESAGASFTAAEADRVLSVLLHLQRLYQAL